MGNLKLEPHFTNFKGEVVYHVVYTATGFIINPLETLEGMKKLRDDLSEAIKEVENEKN